MSPPDGAVAVIDGDQGLPARLLLGPHRRLVVFLALSVVYIVTFGPYTINDTLASSAAAWNLATNGTLDFAEVGFDAIFWGREGVDGGILTDRFPGTFLVAVPAYLVLPRTVVTDGDVNAIPFLTAEVLAAFLVAAAVVVMIEVLRAVVEPAIALGSGLVVALGTPVWSVASSGLWTHTVTMLVLALGLRAVIARRWWWAGTALGWAVFARPTMAVVAAVLGLWLARAERSWRVLGAIAIPSLAGALALSTYTHHYFGTWWPTAGYDLERVPAIVGLQPAMTGSYSWMQQLVGTVVDPWRGVIPSSLFLLPLLVTAPEGWRRAPTWARAAAVSGLAYWAVQLRGNRFTGGESFLGYRLPLDPLWLLMPLLVVGYAAWAGRSQLVRRSTLALAAVAIGWMAALSIAYPTGTMQREPSAQDSSDVVDSEMS